MRYRSLLIATTSLAFLLAGPAVLTQPFGSDGSAAFAKSDKSGGKKSGGKKSGGNKSGSGGSASSGNSSAGNKSGGAGSAGAGQTASAGGKAKKTATGATGEVALAAKGNAKAAKVPGLDAKVGALHAVNANLQAFIHASPNSRVGKIAAYAAATVAVEGAEADVAAATVTRDAAQATLDTATTEFLADEAALTGLATPYGGYSYAGYTAETLEARAAELTGLIDGGTLPDTATIDAVTAERDLVTGLSESLGAFNDATADFADAEQNLADAETAAEAAESAATTALEDAANKPVDEEVRGYVDGALETKGILDYFRAEAEAAETVEPTVE
jgi:hypothetical protein